MDTKYCKLLFREQKMIVLNELKEKLTDFYVFPEVAQEINKKINDIINNGLIDDQETDSFCNEINNVLQSVNKDKHLRVRYLEEVRIPTDEEQEYEEGTWRNNFGFSKVEILPGNVGFIKLNIFDLTSLGGETAVNVMGFVKNTDALIIDLRENGGGDPDMVSLLMSYLINGSVHHTTFYNRIDNEVIQFWTTDFVPGVKYLDKPVYLLTSKHTFSAAESFAYNLKQVNRVTIVGENTGGGAQPGRPHQLSFQFEVFISHGRAINPATNTNWEGVGVNPHIEVESGKALKVAYEQILKGLLNKDDGYEDNQLRKEAMKVLVGSTGQ
ncbi:MAG TPA: S41 family peptidase [Pseudoneobacillus sp.]|nr:S41 family peptidase [Pseudoneobacillus sp.]